MTYDELVDQALTVDISSVAIKSGGKLTLVRTVVPGKGVEVGSHLVQIADSTDNFFIALLIDETRKGTAKLAELYKGDHESVVVKINTTNIDFYNKFLKTIVDAVQ